MVLAGSEQKASVNPSGSASMLVPRFRNVATMASTTRAPSKRINVGQKSEVIVIFHPAVQETERS